MVNLTDKIIAELERYKSLAEAENFSHDRMTRRENKHSRRFDGDINFYHGVAAGFRFALGLVEKIKNEQAASNR